MTIRSKFYLFQCFLAAFALSGRAAETVPHQANKAISTHQWDVVDIGFSINELPEHPAGIDFSADFENESGRRIEVPGIFNGGKDYLIRFTPSSKGTWTYSTKSSHAALDGKAGRLSVKAPREGRKGGVVIDPKAPRQFQYESGDSYYPIAFESDWLFALDAENPSDIPVTRKFVDQLARSGFNQVIMNVFAYDVTWKKDERLVPEHEFGSPRVFPFGGNNSAPDHSQLNIEYFKRLDRVVDYLDQQGIVAHLMVYVWNKRVNWPEAGSEADNLYFDYVAKRYQAYPNLVWDISKEALGYGHTDVNYITERIERLRRLDRYKRLITVHDYSYCRRFTDKVDFISVQLWGSELYGIMRKVCSDMPGKPILNIEHGGYEEGPYVVFTGNYTSAEVCLERAYQCVFAGTYPTHYWQGAAWNVIIPDFEALPPENRPRLHYYKHLQTLVEKYRIDRLTAGEKKSASGFCLHDGKGLFLYFVPKENYSIDVRLPRDAQGKTMTGTWFDPFTGGFGEAVTKKITRWPSFKKPAGEGFRILIVEILSP